MHGLIHKLIEVRAELAKSTQEMIGAFIQDNLKNFILEQASVRNC